MLSRCTVSDFSVTHSCYLVSVLDFFKIMLTDAPTLHLYNSNDSHLVHCWLRGTKGLSVHGGGTVGNCRLHGAFLRPQGADWSVDS